MKEKFVSRKDFITSKWEGGETSQLVIYPEDSIFSNKDFLWRVSSATFTSTKSNFSDFTGYQRYILPLEGELTLDHRGIYSKKLLAYDIDYFDGGWTTFAENTPDCRDYNFIVKSACSSKIQLLEKDEDYYVKAKKMVTLFSVGKFTFKLSNKAEKRELEGFSLYVLEADEDLTLKILDAKSTLILTEFSMD